MTPPAPAVQTIDRSRLAPLVDSRPVVVLAGMAGYGKSTLLGEAHRRQLGRGVTIWLTLDESDRAPARLVSDLVTAADIAGVPNISAQLTTLRDSTLRAEPLTLVDSLLEVFYDAAAPLMLVLDDLQHLRGAAGSEALVDHVLRWAPANMRILMAARVAPALRLQRLRLDERLSYLTHEELAFSPQETADAVRAAGLDLDERAVQSIHGTTGGWPAGVRMAILVARQYGQKHPAHVELRRDQALADYLATEVLGSLSDERRQFVLDSTVDERVCAALVDSIRGSHNAEALLEQCVAEGLFLSRTPTGNDTWYSWHPLFAAHVHRWLAAEDPQRATDGHAAAATWWSTVDPRTAIAHALAAGEVDTASKIFAEHWLEMVLQGRGDAVSDLLGQLPEGSSYAADAHLADALLLVQRGRMDDAEAAVETARASADRLPSTAKAQFEDRAAVVELFRTGYGLGLSAAVAPGAALLHELEARPAPSDPAIVASAQTFVGMGEARLAAQGTLVLQTLRSSAAIAHESGLLALELTALAESCIPAADEGHFGECLDVALDVVARADERGWVGLSTTAPAVAFLGWLDYWRGNLHEARAQLEQSLSTMLPFDWELRGLVLSFHAQVCLSLGDVASAQRSTAQIRELVDSCSPPPAWGSVLAGLEPAVAAAEGRLREAVHGARADAPEPPGPLAQAQRASVLLRAGLAAEALSEIERIPLAGRGAHVECLGRCVQAQALAALRRPGAHVSLERALAAAEPEGLYQPFLEAGPSMRELLSSHLVHGTAYAGTVADILGRLAARPASHRPEQLTQREREILRYLTTNLTAAEIAEAEFISSHTAKTHIRHIYQKLGVGSRRGAVRRAAELDLY